MKCNKLPRLLSYDIKMGLDFNRNKYWLIIVVFLLSFLTFSGQARLSELGSVTIADCFIYILKGMEEYIPSPLNRFEIPVNWLIIHLVLFLITGFYAEHDLYTNGIHILVKAGSKKIWWISKCIWIILTVLVFYLTGLAVIGIACGAAGESSFLLSGEINKILNRVDLSLFSQRELFAAICINPLLVSTALALVQHLLAFIWNPLISYIITVSYVILSVYYYTPVLMGDYSMIIRNSSLDSKGYSSQTVCIISVIVILTAIIGGMFYFDRYEMIKKR